MSLILVVEDETKICEKIVEQLRREGFQSESIGDESDFTVDAVRRISPDVLILDRLLGRIDSLGMIPQLKGGGAARWILVLSAIDSPLEKAKALEAGADDYLSKPFSMTELMARVKALQRRLPAADRSNFEKIGNGVLDHEGRCLVVAGRKIHLTNKEFAVFRALLAVPGRVLSKQRLLEEVWDVRTDVESNSVETTITALRRRLEESGIGIEIRNMRHSGYWIETPNL
ncbi:MAG TPA: response regulator transcription factor [Pseudobdellovibrionaceae bacterium]|nr:response regulator transcription factor [Pseudobdellovibrionaceae bacterium]